MTSSLTNREKAYEAKYAHDQEMFFLIEARRNKLIGLWAAEMMGMDGEDAEAYARSIQFTEIETPGSGNISHRLRTDLIDKGITIDAEIMDEQLQFCLEIARQQILNEVS